MSSMLHGILKICSRLKERVLNAVSIVKIFYLKIYVYLRTPRKGFNTLLNFKQSVYTDIKKMPVLYWNELVETGDLTCLYKRKNGQKLGLYTSRLNDIWLDLQQQHMDEFGIDPMLRARVRAMKKLIDLNIKFVESRDRSLLNLINIEEHKLEETLSGHSVKFYKLLDLVSTHKGYRIDPEVMTVIEWYHALKNMSNGEGN